MPVAATFTKKKEIGKDNKKVYTFEYPAKTIEVHKRHES